MKNALLIFATLLAFSACDKALPPVVAPKAEITKPAPTQASMSDQAVEEKITALHMVFRAVKSMCESELGEAKAKQDIPAFAAALDKCASNFGKLSDLVDKIRMEAHSPKYDKDLNTISLFMRKLARLHHAVRACIKPNKSIDAIDACSVEAIERIKNE